MKHKDSANQSILNFLEVLMNYVSKSSASGHLICESKLSLPGKLLMLLLILAFSIDANCQTYLMNAANNGKTFTTCTGTFYDSGGLPGDYAINENYTISFCSGNGSSAKFTFSSFDVRSGDTLYVYDGSSTASPLMGKYSNTAAPASLISSGTCLTFKFISDGSFIRSGWVAGISCCPPPVTSPITPSDVFQCPGSTINYSVDFHANTTYEWTVTNGTPASFTGGSNNLDITWDPFGDVTGKIKVVEINSCGSKDSSILYVDIYLLQAVDFVGLNAYYCIYSAPVTLTGSPSGGVFSGPGISGSTFTPSFAGVGTHSIMYTYTDPTTLCTNQKVIQTVITVPQVFLVGASANSYCAGSGVNITLSDSETGFSYQLLKNGLNDGAPLAGTGSGLTWTNKQNGVYTVVAIHDLTSCTNNMSGSQTIIQNPLPVPTFTAQPGAATCSSVNVTYTTQPGQSNYLWGFTGVAGTDYSVISGGSASDNSVTLIWLTVGSKSVTINYTNANGCTAVTPTSSNPTIVTLSPPAPTGAAIQNFCSETSPTVANLNATGTAIRWYSAASGGALLPSSTPLSDNTHYYASQTVSGCESILRLDVTAFIFSIPLPPVAGAGTGATCNRITANWTASAGATSYRLDVSILITFATYVAGYQDRNVGNVTSYNVTGLTAGVTYYYRLRAVNFCGTSGNSSTITYATLPAAPATPGAITGITQQCSGSTGQIYSISAVPNATTYTWTVPAGWTITSGQGTISLTVTSGAVGQNGNITVTAGNICGTSTPSILAVSVIPNASITSVTGTTPLCIGSTATYTANGVVLSGGTGAWSSSNGTIATVNAAGLVTGISAGTCNIIYTITGGCGGTKSAQQTVTINPDASITSVTGATPLCIGGTATYTANGVVPGGGTGAWSTSNAAIATVNAAGLVTGISAGTCNIVYTITGGCGGTKSAQQSVTINPNASITSVTGTTPLCIGGTATYSANGVILSSGTGAWSSSNNAVATVSATGLVTGISPGTSNIIYTITGGCGGTVSAFQSVTINPNASITSVTGATPLCIGGTATYIPNGAVTGGGTGTWSSSNNAVATVSATGLVTGISPGTSDIIYTITGGCGGTVSAFQSVTINPNASITSILGNTLLCIGGTTNLIPNGLVLGGGTGAWSSSNPAVATVNAAGLVTGISAGASNIIYTITGGCGGIVSAQLPVTVRPNSSITSVTGTSPLCIGSTATYSANGVVLSGGTGAWSSSNPAVATVNAAGLVTGISAGISNIRYTITGGCGGTVSAQRSVTIRPNASIISVTGATPLCIGENALYTANGVVLSGGTGTWSSSDPAVATVSAAGLVTGISAGTSNISYTITGGCGGVVTSSAGVTVSPPEPLAISYSGSPWCSNYGVQNVTLVGTPGGTYSSTPAGLTINPVTGQITPAASVAATYTITYTLASPGCGIVSTTTTITINQIPLVNTTDPAGVCFPATIDLTAGEVTAGSTPGLSFSFWLDAAATLVYGTPANATSGTYYIKGTDGLGCYDIKPVIVTVYPIPVVTSSKTDVLCSGSSTGAIDITVTGGTGSYTYAWTGNGVAATDEDQTGLSAGLYSIIATDGNGCSSAALDVIISEPSAMSGSITSQTNVSVFGGNDGSVTVDGSGGISPYQYKIGLGVYQPSGSFGTLTAGSYTVTIQDNNLCTFDVLVTITQPLPPLSGSIIMQSDVACFGASTGSVTVEGSGGLAPYEYSLDGAPFLPSGTFSTLPAGNYTVTVRDATSNTHDVSITINQPAEAVGGLISSIADVLCFGSNTGSVTVEGSGGISPYQYKMGTGLYQSSGTFGSLSAGTYTVTIQDVNLCTFDIPVTIIHLTGALSASIISQTDISCSGAANGSITVAGSGGVLPYEYSINGGSYQSSATFNDLDVTTYIITVRDANLCTADISATITEPEPLSIAYTKVDVSCPDEDDGKITLSISGGTPPYFTKWSDDVTDEDRVDLPEGPYTVDVTDMNTCIESLDVIIEVVGSDGCLEIPTIITPNDDSYNDVWVIKNIDLFPNAEVFVFNRWGKQVFRTKNLLANPWDGTFDGKLLPTDSYHYVLHLNNGSEPRSGVISIIK